MPAVQFVHAAALTFVGTKVPGVQEEQFTEPVALAYMPAGHAMQEAESATG